MVHDGVRPLVTEDILSRSLSTAAEHGACVVGWPVKETIKKVDPENFVRETIDRRALWNIQTPQTFHYEILKRAIVRAGEEKFFGTDESMLGERLGVRVKVILGSPENIKITTPEDFSLAETILKMRRPL